MTTKAELEKNLADSREYVKELCEINNKIVRELEAAKDANNDFINANNNLESMKEEIIDALVLYKNLKYPDTVLQNSNTPFGYIATSINGEDVKPDTEELLFIRHLYNVVTGC